MDLGSYYSGKVITSGLYQLWLSEGILNQSNLKLASLVKLISSLIYLFGGYIHFHISFLTNSFVCKLSSISNHHILISFSLGLPSWSGHNIHIALPLNKLLTSGLTPNLVPYPHDLFILVHTSQNIPWFYLLCID